MISRPIFTLNNTQGKTLLCAAVLSGHQALLELLLGLGVDPNSVDEYDDRLVSALHLAVESGRAEMVARLLRAGADPNRQVEQSRREHHANSTANPNEAAAHANVFLPGRTPLHVAIERQQVECVRELLRALPSQQLQKSSHEADQPDSSSAPSGNSSEKQPPLPLNLNKADANDNTPLHEAVLRLRESSQQGTCIVVILLLDPIVNAVNVQCRIV